MRSIRLLLGLMVLLTFNACITFEQVELENVEDVRVENILNSDPLRVYLDMKINNPNTFKIKIKKADLNLYVGSKDLGMVHLGKKVTLPKKSTTVQTFIIEPDFKSAIKKALAGSASALLTGKITVRIKGRVKGSVMGIGKWFDVDQKEEINLKDKLFLAEPIKLSAY